MHASCIGGAPIPTSLTGLPFLFRRNPLGGTPLALKAPRAVGPLQIQSECADESASRGTRLFLLVYPSGNKGFHVYWGSGWVFKIHCSPLRPSLGFTSVQALIPYPRFIGVGCAGQPLAPCLGFRLGSGLRRMVSLAGRGGDFGRSGNED